MQTVEEALNRDPTSPSMLFSLGLTQEFEPDEDRREALRKVKDLIERRNRAAHGDESTDQRRMSPIAPDSDRRMSPIALDSDRRMSPRFQSNLSSRNAVTLS